MDINVRKMEEKDAKRAGELEKANFSQPWTEQAFLETLCLDYAYYYAAEQDGKIIGICGLRNIMGEGEITNVIVDEGYRRLGVAAMLLAHTLKAGAEKGMEAFTLEVRAGNTAAISLYEKFGFAGEGIRKNFYSLPEEDAVIMWKR